MKSNLANKRFQFTAGPGLQKRSVPYEVQDWRVNRGQWTSIDADWTPAHDDSG